MKKRILVTGGAGFIGSHLVERLVGEGYFVTVLDNLSRGSKKNLKRVEKQIRLETADIRDIHKITSIFKKQDVVFNLAAVNTGVDFDQGKTEYMFEENMLLQMNPLKAAYLTNVPKFIQVSSASIYSKKAMEKRIPTNEDDDGEEPEESKLGYAFAKRMGEKLAEWYSENTTMHTVIARPINAYGTRDNFDKMGHFIPCMIKKFLKEKSSVEVFGSGNQKRSFIHVDDLVDALLLLADKGKRGVAYNIDVQDERSVKEIVTQINLCQKKKLKIIYNKRMPEGSKRRMLDNRRIIKLGWKPKHTLIDTIPELIEDIKTRMHE